MEQMGFEGGPVVKNLPTNAGDARDNIRGFDPWLGKNFCNPLQFLAWKILDRGTWQVTVHGVKKSQTALSTHTYIEKDVW